MRSLGLFTASIALMAYGCTQPGAVENVSPPIGEKTTSKISTHSAADVADIKELVLRTMLRSPGVNDRITFVDFGDVTRTDPSPEFLARFRDLNIELHPVSQTVFPKGVERDPSDPDKYLGVKDSVTHKDAVVYSARVRWIDYEHVEVEGEGYISPLGAFGSLFTLEKRDGRWRIQAKRNSWVA